MLLYMQIVATVPLKNAYELIIELKPSNGINLFYKNKEQTFDKLAIAMYMLS